MSNPGVAHRLEHALFTAVSAVVRHLPEPWALALGAGLGRFAGSALRVRRRVVDENLARAFPDRSARWRRGVAVSSYAHLGRESVVLLRVEGMTSVEIRERCRVTGIEPVRDAVAAGRGVLLLTGHLGNWEMGGAVLAAHGIPIDVVAKKQRNPLFEARLRRTREGLGMRVVYRHDATREVLRSLREGRAVALVADQNARTGGIFVDFFGTPAATVRGPALLAARTGASVLTALPFREDGPAARYHLVLAPLQFEPVGDADADLLGFTRAYHAALETGIRQAPEQYFWFHQRWKTRPDAREEPDPEGAVPSTRHTEQNGDEGGDLGADTDSVGSS